jgi:F-type H+-transporting ATPase subunit b
MNKTFAILLLLVSCAEAVAEENPQASEQGIFTGTFADALWTVLAFFVLLIVLGKFAWRPLLANLRARAEHISHQIQSAQDTRHQAEKLLEDHRQQGLQVIEDATEQAMLKGRELTKKAQQDVGEVKRKSQEDIKNACAEFSEQMWHQAGDIALSVGSEVLGRTITKGDNERLIDEAVEKIRQENHLWQQKP